ncbi:GNAT family N-acetyltransferase [Roseomonas sp. NAR14]|uniref:GNAT family N-acetyltransferase n=1 Tax=Roseomonas acroporae TaxID=2937791 RepID=A0A9X2BTN8_9PROT|nr:GNAT family N-acetyltransferase [Roseomonas acroporae]MCK8783416.1 GNAT family N-acetyltransferase [Roseomonas acroporae]
MGWMNGPVIETARLVLRPPLESDLDDWAEFMADPEAQRYLGGPQPRLGAWRSLMAMAGSWTLKGFSMFSVVERESGRWVGRLGPWQPEGWPGTEIGWGLARHAWGRGYATEGAEAATAWAFDALGWREVIHLIAPENIASQAVAARLGSRRRGPGMLPAPYDTEPVETWGQDRAAWRARG